MIQLYPNPSQRPVAIGCSVYSYHYKTRCPETRARQPNVEPRRKFMEPLSKFAGGHRIVAKYVSNNLNRNYTDDGRAVSVLISV